MATTDWAENHPLHDTVWVCMDAAKKHQKQGLPHWDAPCCATVPAVMLGEHACAVSGFDLADLVFDFSILLGLAESAKSRQSRNTNRCWVISRVLKYYFNRKGKGVCSAVL